MMIVGIMIGVKIGYKVLIFGLKTSINKCTIMYNDIRI